MLTVEDGTGLPNAEAYISVADADTYFSDRDNAAWAALDLTQKEAALRKGADYLRALYGRRWLGFSLNTTQALDWPRAGYGVPQAIARANAELALRASAGDLLADEGVQVLSEKVGPIEVTYAAGGDRQTRFALIDGMLGPWLGVGGVAWAIRA